MQAYSTGKIVIKKVKIQTWIRCVAFFLFGFFCLFVCFFSFVLFYIVCDFIFLLLFLFFPLQNMMLASISFVLKIFFSPNFLSFHVSNVASYQLCVISMHIRRFVVPLIPCPLTRWPACVSWGHQLLFTKVTVVIPALQQQEVLVRNIAFREKGLFCIPKVKQKYFSHLTKSRPLLHTCNWIPSVRTGTNA